MDRIKDGVTNIFLEAPTGVGKSYLAWTVARYCQAEMGWRTRILVPNLYLEAQYITDFSQLGMLRLEASRHYKCPEFKTCDIGRGNEMVHEPPPAVASEGSASGGPAVVKSIANRGESKCKDLECSYLMARSAFESCPVGVSNTAYALTCARFGHRFVSGDFLIVDEAHNLADQIAALYEVSVDCSLAPEDPPIGQELAWLKTVHLPILKKRITALQMAVASMEAPPDDVIAKLSRLTNDAVDIAFVTDTPANEWVVTRPEGSILVQPLWASRVAPRLLNFLAPLRLFMSGTFLDYNHHVASLGL